MKIDIREDNSEKIAGESEEGGARPVEGEDSEWPSSRRTCELITILHYLSDQAVFPNPFNLLSLIFFVHCL